MHNIISTHNVCIHECVLYISTYVHIMIPVSFFVGFGEIEEH